MPVKGIRAVISLGIDCESFSMRVLINDYGGYSFSVQLSRVLARRGYEVRHVYAGYNTTPKGDFNNKADDPPSFFVKALYTNLPLQKYSFVKRWSQEREYGGLLVAELKSFEPDMVISANNPLDAQYVLQKYCKTHRIKFIFWLQDILGIAAEKILSKKIPLVGLLLGKYYIWMERKLLRNSDGIVLISQDFEPLMKQWGICQKKIHLIPNWAPLEDINPQPKSNPWSKAHQLTDRFCFLYTGSLGLKHDPSLLMQLALHFQSDSQVLVVVVSEGMGSEWLLNKKREHGLQNLMVMDYQILGQLQFVLASADVLIAVLESEAGIFSVPSKVLTYMCAQRPLLLAIPAGNLAARIVNENQAGLVVEPGDTKAFINAALTLRGDHALREILGKRGRTYAEKAFDIQRITDQFEQVLLQ
jgi:colanic acid biosynthesis glycosyl transferase WcaI